MVTNCNLLAKPSNGAATLADVREFGVAADFRAGLHCGRVAVGEVASLKKEIALIGDTMDTAHRIQEACRDRNHRVLASAAVIDRLAPLPSA